MPDQVPPPVVIAVQRTAGAPAKPLWRSRTVWFNGVCFALAAAEAQLGVLKDALPGGLYASLAFVLPVGNVVLRYITNTGVTLSRGNLPDAPNGVQP